MLGRIAKQLAGQAARQMVSSAKEQHTASKTPAPREPELGLLFSLALEAGPTWERMDAVAGCQVGRLPAAAGRLGRKSCVAAVGGVGRRAAAKSAAQLLELAPKLVISAGLASAADDSLRRGDVLLADVIHTRSTRWAPAWESLAAENDERWKSLRIRRGGLLTTERLVQQPQERRQLGAELQVLACDTESAWIAEACEAHGTPCLAVRVICDEANDELPADLAAIRQQNTSAARLGATAGAVFRQPGRALDLWNLRQTAIEAATRLADVFVELLK